MFKVYYKPVSAPRMLSLVIFIHAPSKEAARKKFEARYNTDGRYRFVAAFPAPKMLPE